MSAVDDRRKALVKVLASLGTETQGFTVKAAALLKSNKATVERDLVALAAGELPAGESEGDPEKHRSVAKIVRGIKNDEDAAKAMLELGGGVLDGDLDPKRVTVAQTILVGMRYFTARPETTGKGGGKGGDVLGSLSAIPAAPLGVPGAVA